MNDPSLAAFGFSLPPFHKEISDADLWLPPSKAVLVDELVETIEARRSASLVGEPGAGKTCVLRALRRRLPPERFRLTYSHHATLGRRDFYRQLCGSLGLSPKATAAAVFHAITSHVQEISTRAHPVFFLDEAHLLQPDVLGHLHILLNYEWDSRALLSVILIGLPELEDRLALNSHKSLLSRLHARLRIATTTTADTADYLRYRLHLAGCDRDLFSPEAVALLHEASLGLHRDIDRLASLALREAVRRKCKSIDQEILRHLLSRAASAA
jgi:type II secretory pathway predicted ATPase ExeA